MRLDAVGQVVKGGGIFNLAGHEAAGEVRNLIRQTPPHAAGLFLGSVRGWRDGVPLDDQRIQVDHLLVVVQEVDDDLARDARGQGRDGCECRALRHGSFFAFSLFVLIPERDISLSRRNTLETIRLLLIRFVYCRVVYCILGRG